MTRSSHGLSWRRGRRQSMLDVIRITATGPYVQAARRPSQRTSLRPLGVPERACLPAHLQHGRPAHQFLADRSRCERKRSLFGTKAPPSSAKGRNSRGGAASSSTTSWLKAIAAANSRMRCSCSRGAPYLPVLCCRHPHRRARHLVRCRHFRRHPRTLPFHLLQDSTLQPPHRRSLPLVHSRRR